jgi:hypothetical protein
MLAPPIPARQCARRQAKAGERHELVAFEPEQAGGIAWDDAPYRIQQSAVAVLGRQRRGEIARDVEQRIGRARLCV